MAVRNGVRHGEDLMPFSMGRRYILVTCEICEPHLSAEVLDSDADFFEKHHLEVSQGTGRDPMIKRRISVACRDVQHWKCRLKNCICDCHQKTLVELNHWDRITDEIH